MIDIKKFQDKVDKILESETKESLLDYFRSHWRDPALGKFTYISPITGGVTIGEYNHIERYDEESFKVDRNDYVFSTTGIKYKLSEVKIELYENTNTVNS